MSKNPLIGFLYIYLNRNYYCFLLAFDFFNSYRLVTEISKNLIVTFDVMLVKRNDRRPVGASVSSKPPGIELEFSPLPVCKRPSEAGQRGKQIGVVDFGLDDELRALFVDKLPEQAHLLKDPARVDTQDYGLLLVPVEALKNSLWSKFISKAAKEVSCKAFSVLDYDVGEAALAWPRSTFYLNLRAIADVGVSLVALILLLPVFAVVALLTFATMGRPVLFVQERIGLNGRIFKMYKFRTMLQSATANKIATVENDKRITFFGHFLRRLHIDELPQLWNILIGDMSFIGPRPEQPSLVERYRSNIPNFDLRHAIKPGLTGWAQVRSGYAANEKETRRKLDYDLYYLRHQGFILDLKVIYLTLTVLFDSRHVR